MKNFWIYIERATSLAILLIIAVIGYRFAFPPQPQMPPAPPGSVRSGDTIKAAARYLTQDKTLVAVVSSSCIHCTRSLPALKQIVDDMRGKAGTMAVFPAADPHVREFLTGGNIDMATYPGLSSSDFKIRGTPTFMILDRSGKVLDLWVGELSPDSVKAIKKAVS